MPEGTFGESSQEQAEVTASESPTETTEQQESSNSEESSEGSKKPQSIPYQRFKEVNEELKAIREENAQFRERITPILESQRQPEPDPVDPTQFNSIEEYDEYMENKISEREQRIEQRTEAKIAAMEKLSELKEAYPEMKTDPQFRKFVIREMQENPGVDAMNIAKQTKEYLGKIEGRGRDAAKKEFLEKGAFHGKSEGNRPYAETDADKQYKQNIVNAGGKSGIF